MGNGALPNGPSYRAHPRLYQDIVAAISSLRKRLARERPAEEFRAFQPVSPEQLDRLGNSDPHACDDVQCIRARMQRDPSLRPMRLFIAARNRLKMRLAARGAASSADCRARRRPIAEN